MAGLFGIGGGFIIVPLLLFVLPEIGIESELATHFAIGTSLACIVITSISSTRSHHLRQSVNWQILKTVTPGLILGSILASKIASLVSGTVLMSTFVVGALLTAVYLFFSQTAKAETRTNTTTDPDQPKEHLSYFLFGNFTGFISSLIGIGGGSILVPFYVFKGQSAHKAVGTAAACGFPVALFGAIGYLINGLSHTQSISHSSGYIYWPAFIGIVVFSVLGAPIGAKVAHAFEETTLKKVFAVFLVFTGGQIIYTQWFS